MAERKKPVRVLGSGLTGRYYAVTRYSEDDAGQITVHSNGKHDVTEDVRAIIDAALAESDLLARDALRLMTEGEETMYQAPSGIWRVFQDNQWVPLEAVRPDVAAYLDALTAVPAPLQEDPADA